MQRYYNVGRRSKWWKRVFSYVVEVAAYNAFVTTEFAHKKSTGQTPRDYLAFRMSLGEELIGSFSSRQRAGRPRSLRTSP